MKYPFPTKIQYQAAEDGAHLVHCWSDDETVSLPPQVNGLPVIEIDSYAFSLTDSAEYHRAQKRNLQTALEETLFHSSSCTPIGGNRLTAVELPDGVKGIGDYTFYNCRNLHSLRLTDSVCSIGDGAFKNCEKLTKIVLTCQSGSTVCLHRLAAEIQHEIQVSIHYGNSDDAALCARLTFPAYFEEHVENGPARIFEWFAHGSGYRYRQCFRDGSIDYEKYDALFPAVVLEDPTGAAVRIAMGRLRFPYQLTSPHRAAYWEHLRQYSAEALHPFIQSGDLETVEFFAAQQLLTAENAEVFLKLASQAKQAEILSFLLDYQHRHLRTQAKTFEL